MEPPAKRKRLARPELPLDCWGHVLLFLSEYSDYVTLLRVVSGLHNYCVNLCPGSSRHIRFILQPVLSQPLGRKPLLHVWNLSVRHQHEEGQMLSLDADSGSDAPTSLFPTACEISLLASTFPNVVSLSCDWVGYHCESGVLRVTVDYSPMRNLVVLHLSGLYSPVDNDDEGPDRVADKGVGITVVHPTLKRLHLEELDRVDDDRDRLPLSYVSVSGTVPLLESITVDATVGIDTIDGMDSLKFFRVDSGGSVLDRRISSLKSLETVELFSSSFELAVFSDLPALTSLFIGESSSDDPLPIRGFPNLERLWLGEVVVVLGESLDSLHELVLDSTCVVLGSSCALPRLEILTIENALLQDPDGDAITELNGSMFPSLAELRYLGDDLPPEALVVTVREFSNLRRLSYEANCGSPLAIANVPMLVDPLIVLKD